MKKQKFRKKINFPKILKFTATIIMSVLVIFGVVKAGTITAPSGTPTAQFYSLAEIYEFIANNTTATEGGHDFTFSDSLAGTSHTLTEIYDALAGLISADQVKLGKTYLNVAGTLIPSGGTATTTDVCSTKTYFGANQTDWNFATGTLAIDASKVLSGTTYCSTNGTMANNNSFSLTCSVSDQSVTAGYYSGGTLAGDADLVVGKIKSGVDLFGITGDYPSATYPLSGNTVADDATVGEVKLNYEAWTKAGSLLTGTLTPDDGTASTADLFSGKTAYLTTDWTLDIGALNLACNTATFDGTANKVADAYDGGGNGSNRWCVATSSNSADATKILSGYKSWVNGIELTGNISTQTLSNSTTTVAAGYYNADNLVSIDTDLVTGNIKSNITIFGIAGDSNVVNTSSGDAISSDILSGKIAWVDGSQTTGSANCVQSSAPTSTIIKTGESICGVNGSYSASGGNPCSPPKTGQTTSYDTGDADDGYYEKGCTLSYTDNGDGTITDNCTGLMWKKCSDPDTSTTTCGGTHSTYTWENALSQCEGLDYASHTDWRLPNAKELWSIAKLEPGDAPYIDQTTFPGTVSSYYWSSTTCPSNTDLALDARFNVGYQYNSNKISSRYVRCVR